MNLIWLLFLLAYNLSPETGPVANQLPSELQGVGIEEKVGQFVPMDVSVVNELGEPRPLSSFLSGRPILLSFVYYNCPALCSLHLNGVLEGLSKIEGWLPGKQYDYWVISFDPKETSDLALAKKKRYLSWIGWEGQSQVEAGFRFFTADAQSIQKLTQAVGFKYKWNDKINEWMHASAVVFLSPEGQITRYLHGVMFEPDQLKLAIMDAASGRLGNIVEKLIWFCYRYDAHQNKYVPYVWRIIQLSFAVFSLSLIGVLTYWHFRPKGVA